MDYNAYRMWVREHYPEDEIDWDRTYNLDIYAQRAFNYRFYQNDPIDEVDPVRNVITHFNECRMKYIPPPEDTYDLKQVREVVYVLFPDICTDLFDFWYKCGVYLDFTAARTYYNCIDFKKRRHIHFKQASSHKHL